MSQFPQPVAITGIALRTCLGSGPREHLAALQAGRSGLRPLSEQPALPAGWLEDRGCLKKSRRYGAASNLAVSLAQEAVKEAGWSEAETTRAWIMAGSSRGNVGELLGEHHGRRRVSKFAASNSMHSEIAAAVSIELGIHGGWQMLSNGCSSGLDALGLAAGLVAAGMAPRAVVVSVDLPLIPALLADFAATGLLSTNGVNDPYSTATTGFLPAEGGAAILVEPVGTRPAMALVHGYWVNSDAWDAVGLPKDGGPIRDLIAQVLAERPETNIALCPHASGTALHGHAELAALNAAFPAVGKRSASLHLMKPFTGHSLGASGAVDAAILATFLQQQQLPPNLPGLSGAGGALSVPDTARSAKDTAVLKISSGMGGHNAAVLMTTA
ncbi:MAG: hypothetical protein H7A55_15045 [Verrucomicrobiaceae bacterium]|nr:hypothetical protein [Verrucomicrobiaceae bacterium]